MKSTLAVLVSILFLFISTEAQNKSEDQDNYKKQSAAVIIEKVLDEAGIQAAKIKLDEIIAQGELKYAFVEREFLTLGYKLLRSGKNIGAISIIQKATSLFPRSSGLFLALGNAYRAIGNIEMDRKCINKSFEIRDKDALRQFYEKTSGNLAVTAEEVIERHLEAIGGRDNQFKIKTMVIEYSDFNTINQKTLMKRFYKFPHFIRVEFPSNGTINITDGQKVWRKTPKGWAEQTRSNWIYSPDIYNDFIDYQRKGIIYTLLGLEAIDDHVYYHLLKRYKDGEERDFFFSAETGLFRMERRDFGIGKDVKNYWDYRKVEGILFPFLFTVNIDVGFGRIHGGIVKNIQVNVPLDDSLFVKTDGSKETASTSLH